MKLWPNYAIYALIFCGIWAVFDMMGKPLCSQSLILVLAAPLLLSIILSFIILIYVLIKNRKQKQ